MDTAKVMRELQLPDVGQIGIVVDDQERSIKFFESVLGVGPFDVVETEAPNVWDRGEEKHIKARLAFAMSGQVQIELIKILEGDSFHLESLRERGENIHHLGFTVKDYLEKLEKAKAMGFEVLQSGPEGRFYAYLDTRKACGIIVELIEDFSQDDA